MAVHLNNADNRRDWQQIRRPLSPTLSFFCHLMEIYLSKCWCLTAASELIKRMMNALRDGLTDGVRKTRGRRCIVPHFQIKCIIYQPWRITQAVNYDQPYLILIFERWWKSDWTDALHHLPLSHALWAEILRFPSKYFDPQSQN